MVYRFYCFVVETECIVLLILKRNMQNSLIIYSRYSSLKYNKNKTPFIWHFRTQRSGLDHKRLLKGSVYKGSVVNCQGDSWVALNRDTMGAFTWTTLCQLVHWANQSSHEIGFSWHNLSWIIGRSRTWKNFSTIAYRALLNVTKSDVVWVWIVEACLGFHGGI